MSFNQRTPIAAILADERARAVFELRARELLTTPHVNDIRSLPVGVLVEPPRLFREAGMPGVRDVDLRERIWADLASIDPDLTVGEKDTLPDPEYEDDAVEPASARIRYPSSVPQWGVFEVRLSGPQHGNPFVDVDLYAHIASGDDVIVVGGFYDGDGTFIVRFMPHRPGPCTFHTTSTARSLDGLTGSFEVTPPDPSVHGPVRVAETYHFRYADGTRFVPMGTTAYAWTHQAGALPDRTLRTLSTSPFTKVRMCLLPKSFVYNDNEPPVYPFPGSTSDGWDTRRFIPEYFRRIEFRIQQLAAQGIEADLILLHPYDRWGFSTLGRAALSRLLTYAVRRLSAYRNIWWSMANEYDLLPLTDQDWQYLASVVDSNDHVGHLVSIHNWVDLYDNSQPWVTHCSVQAGDGLANEATAELRRRWSKPVVIDECGYEGDLDQGWGNLTAEELVSRAWATTIRGGYVTHGETYLNDREEIFWSKGGELVGESPARLDFLAGLIAASPTGVIDPIPFGPFNWDVPYAGVPDRYYLAYLGSGQSKFRNIRLPEGQQYHVDIVDTWNMTINRLDGTRGGTFRIDLPGRPYIALRFVRVDT
jgi:Domain of unknown function (DUF5605)/Domain of unknown function (DUF5060)/Protein of unknown function (DUF4038)